MDNNLLENLSLIGRRLRAIRHARGKSLEVIAGLAGISACSLSEFERGIRIPRTEHIISLATALEISPEDLMKLPFPTPGNGHMDSAIQAVRLAVLGVNQGYPGGRVVSVEELRSRVQAALTMSWQCDRPKMVGSLLPDIIKDLHTSILAGWNVAELLDMAGILHYHVTLWWLRVAGASLDLRGQVTALMMWAARERGTAEALGIAANAGIQIAILSGDVDLAQKELDLSPTKSASVEALQVTGTLTLSRSWIASVAGHQGDAEDALAEAEELAQRTDEGDAYGLSFGPIEVGMWRVLALVESGDHEQAIHVGKDVNRDAHPHRSRQASGWVTYARALAEVSGRREDAILALKHAEMILPLEVQRNQRARDLLAQIITKARYDALGAELRGMAYRAGVGL